MTDDEIIAVVQAHKEGKEIQWRERCAPQLSWIDITTSMTAGWFGWDFKNIVYRVKPEPRKLREWWIEPIANRVWNEGENYRPCNLVRVREVIE